jgi:glutamine amidotransferase-like uncharacterized protein
MALLSVIVDSDNDSVSTAHAGKLLRLFDGYADGPFRGPFTLVRDNGGSEIADCILYNDFRGGIHVWINGGWKRFNDEETAFNSFLETDHWAS